MPVGFSEKIPPPSLETSIFPTGTVFHPPQFRSVQKLFRVLSKDTPDGVRLGAGEGDGASGPEAGALSQLLSLAALTPLCGKRLRG